MSTLDTLIADLYRKVEPATRHQIDKLLDRPEVAAIREQVDGDDLTAHRQLVELLAGVPGKHAKAIADTAKEATRAALAAAKAEADYHRTRAENMQAGIAASGAVAVAENEAMRLQLELRAGADTRLHQLVTECRKLIDEAGNSIFVLPAGKVDDFWTGEKYTAIASNHEAIQTAIAACRSVINSSLDAMLLAEDRAQVTARLNGCVLELQAGLDPLGLSVLYLNERGELTRDKDVPTGRHMSDLIIQKRGGANVH